MEGQGGELEEDGDGAVYYGTAWRGMHSIFECGPWEGSISSSLYSTTYQIWEQPRLPETLLKTTSHPQFPTNQEKSPPRHPQECEREHWKMIDPKESLIVFIGLVSCDNAQTSILPFLGN